ESVPENILSMLLLSKDKVITAISICLFPAVLNLATMADITTNATCGSTGPEMFCKLVEHVPGQPVRNAQCRICNQRSANPTEHHPIEYAIDGTNRWWQSPSIKNGMEYHYVTITLDLKQVFQIAYVIIKAANSPRPGNWILERSIDGVTFEPWQYYAITDTECLTRFNIYPRTGPPSYTRDDEVICTSFYSKIHPLENGEIHTSLINGRPSADDPSPTLLNFTSARYIRLVFQRIRTLNADLMTLTLHDPKDMDPIVTRRYYYTIKDISVGGMCICFGHAKACPLDSVTKFSCECEHNTCGESCDRCCPGYHQQPWMAGTFLTRHVCEKCNCHGKAEECYFNQTVADLSLSLDIHGQYRGGGVCIGCHDDTAGINCQSCVPGFYRPADVSAEEENPCIPCSCDPYGSISQTCVADSSQATPRMHSPAGSCWCKEGFGGLRCDRCAIGYMGYPYCERCNCSVEGSVNADPCITPCICKENVEGENCDRCKLGFYNLQESNRRGCEKCSCMGVSSHCTASTWTYQNVGTHYSLMLLHSFSMEVANPTARGERRASAVEVCSCPYGYAGTSCEACALGFRRVNGNLYNGVCEPCHCHGHTTQCHEVTGHCLDCSHNTAGPYCDTCLPGYYGNATRGSPADCQPCACPLNIPSNNFSPTCHLSQDGELLCDQCRPGYTGPRCDRCSNGYYGQPTVPGGSCRLCDCNGNLDLSIPGSCDPNTGRCLRCRQGYGGEACDSCAVGYYGDAIIAKNCQSCQCHTNGSISEVCNQETGECRCKENVLGQKCDKCRVSVKFSILTSLHQGCGTCIPCHCNSYGSKSFDCDENGQCRCQPGVTGPKCDRCSRGYFNFQEGGCTPCQCSHVGNNCDANTGQCICPPKTIGERCDRCAPNHWGHDIVTGCKECGCNVIGSVTQQCNVNTGCCICHDSFRGDKCNECQIGYRDFPQCIQCKCNIAGSDSQTCDQERGACGCADRTGKCSCKENVEGDYCDRCKPDAFGLSLRNPLGCSRCYCYGLTHFCTEAQGLIRMWLTLKPEQTVLPLVDKSNAVETRTGVSFQHPEIIVHAELITSALSEPYYWKLPEQFKAYGGQLKYAVYYEAREETGPSSYEPQVIIKGGPNHNMVMTRHITGLQIGQLTRHEIDMTEHEWKFADGRTMTREDFMDILFYVDYILIKASHGNLMRQSRISEISLTVAEEGIPTKESEKAHQIENCDCPIGYSGLSCEECAAGFYRLRSGFLASAPASRVPTATGMASCVQCQCSGHSSSCDPETSICQNCQDNTEGDRCERCAPGFYGVVRGSPDDCKPCACPLTNPQNNFSPTCVAEGFDDYRCTACPEGYEGKHCERCATGYHGNPRIPGSHCEECKCSLWGALPGPCDPVTGQCRCRVGASGMTCDQCMDRHVEIALSCDDECSGLLISDMDRLLRIINEVTLTTPLPPPYKVLYRFENMTEELKHMLSRQKAPERLLQLADSNLGSLVTEMDQLHSRVKPLSFSFDSNFVSIVVCLRPVFILVSLFLCVQPENLESKAAELNQSLSRRGGTPEKSLSEMKEEIQAMLHEMRQRQLGGKKVIAEEENNELGTLHDQLDDRVSHLTYGLSDGRLAYRVQDAEEHAKQLNDSAAILDGILAEAKNLSFNATAAFNAYSNIKANVDAAEKEAKAAKQRASEALALVRGRAPSRMETLALQYTSFMFHSLTDTAARLAATKAVAADANATAIDVLERLGDLNLRLGGLERNYTDLKETVMFCSVVVFDLSLPSVHAAGAKVKDLEDEADRLLEKLQPIKKLQDNLRRNISQIKELINQARKQANSIKVSVSSGGDCLRSYRPDIRKGRYNTIILHVKTTTPDNLLFYLGSAKYVDFLALEMRKGKVNFLWDVGSGVGRVEYPHHTIHDGNWHRIEASRNGLNGTISVYPLEGSMAGMMPTPASANSPTAFTILDVDQNAYLFVGGIFGSVKKAETVRTTTFTGCMGETFLDGKPIGLWNYREREGDCKGCVVSPQRSHGEGTVQLDGEGYAAVGRPTRWNPNVSTITFKFRTFSSDALLMYMAAEDMKDFVSLELSEGKVKVNFDLGSGVGSANSSKRHNDGHWKSLTMSRNKKHSTVSIVDIDSSDEEKIVATSLGSATGLNLKEHQKIYFGGLPTIGNYSIAARSEVILKRYAGCLRDIEISRTPYNLLSSSDYTGVTKGCNVENLHTVSFSKPGYMELSGLSLAVDTEISLSFSTLEDTGTILLAVGGGSPNRQKVVVILLPYLSVMLTRGSLEVVVSTGSHNRRQATRRPEQGTLNDGREHTLRIERLAGRSFAIQVDDEARMQGVLPNDQPLNLQRIFLGGIPAEVEQTSNRANIPFKGCIWNLMINAVYVKLYLVSVTDMLCPNLQESCASAVAPTALEKAYQFGLTRNSHMSFAFDDNNVRDKLKIEFELRTKESSGLIFYMARINHADFVSIQIKNGQVCLGYDLGHGNISDCVPYSINDGSWHKVQQFLTLSKYCINELCSFCQADLLDVVGILYIGGLPQNYTTKRIGPILYSINGCIRDLRVAGSPVGDMATPTSSHMVGRCFVATETGTYFEGTGFLKAVSSYRVGLDVSIALEFRTSRTSGVLLAVSNQGNDGLGLEIVDGKLLFHVDNGAGRFTAVRVPQGEGFCDGQWHSVTATKKRNKLELVVDGKQSEAASPYAQSVTCDTSDPIYVGGYPAGVHQAALSTSTSFNGCIRNLKITKSSKTMEVHFNKALEIRGVQPLSCPAVAA
uniref:Laminin subunit alpha-2 n=1 Tax=Oreochromis niloticus TaxID=8128 RepID=A0A669EDF2_ORENI